MGGAAGGTTTDRQRGANSPRTPSDSPPTQRAPRRLRWPKPKLLLAGTLVVVTVSFAGWALYGSSWFRVERVSVSGTEKLSVAEVRKIADVKLDAPLVAVDKSAVERRLTRSLRRVDTVEVVRDWPHGINVKVTERKPAAVTQRPGHKGQFLEVDAKGVRYGVVAKRPPGVPLLVMDLDKAADSPRFGADRLRREAVVVATELPASVRKEAQAIRVRSFDSITVELTANRMVMWGSSEYGAAKAKSLRALMAAHNKGSGARYFDVSVPSAPAVSGS